MVDLSKCAFCIAATSGATLVGIFCLKALKPGKKKLQSFYVYFFQKTRKIVKLILFFRKKIMKNQA